MQIFIGDLCDFWSFYKIFLCSILHDFNHMLLLSAHSAFLVACREDLLPPAPVSYLLKNSSCASFLKSLCIKYLKGVKSNLLKEQIYANLKSGWYFEFFLRGAAPGLSLLLHWTSQVFHWTHDSNTPELPSAEIKECKLVHRNLI